MTRMRPQPTGRDWTCVVAGLGVVLAALTPVHAAHANDVVITSPAAQREARKLDNEPPVTPRGNRIVVDHSGRKEAGKASIYAHSFDGRKMANGKRYDPRANVAASKTLPLGTIAKVTNIETGKSTEVKVEDRGPFVDGRVVDLTPHAAHQIGLTGKEGVAPVIVAPVTVPQTDGSAKIGAGADIEQASSAPAE